MRGGTRWADPAGWAPAASFTVELQREPARARQWPNAASLVHTYRCASPEAAGKPHARSYPPAQQQARASPRWLQRPACTVGSLEKRFERYKLGPSMLLSAGSAVAQPVSARRPGRAMVVARRSGCWVRWKSRSERQRGSPHAAVLPSLCSPDGVQKAAVGCVTVVP